MNSLSSYLQELRSLPPEKSVEPEFKNQDRQKQDQKIRWCPLDDPASQLDSMGSL